MKSVLLTEALLIIFSIPWNNPLTQCDLSSRPPPIHLISFVLYSSVALTHCNWERLTQSILVSQLSGPANIFYLVHITFINSSFSWADLQSQMALKFALFFPLSPSNKSKLSTQSYCMHCSLFFSPCSSKSHTLPWHMHSGSIFFFTSVLASPLCASIPRLSISATIHFRHCLTLSVASFTLCHPTEMLWRRQMLFLDVANSERGTLFYSFH